MATERIYLVGPRACGKTTVGKAVASQLGWQFVDTDDVVVANAGKSIADIVAESGWEGFRDAESQALAQVSEQRGVVIATGGGMVLRKANRACMQEHGVVVRLTASIEVLAERLAADPLEAQRPTLTGKTIAEEVADVLREREPAYTAATPHTVDATLPVANIAEKIVVILEREAS